MFINNDRSLKKKEKIRKICKEILEDILIFGFFCLFFSRIICLGVVSSESMEPLMKKGDFVVCNRLAYINSEPQRGDIIVFEFVEYGERKQVIKRIVGLPGEHIEYMHGKVYIDGKILEEDYLEEDVYTWAFQGADVPKDLYYVLGDNRDNSYDSRFWEKPFVPIDKIIGKYVWQVSIPFIY